MARKRGRLMVYKMVQHTRDPGRDTRAHQNVVDTGQHRAVDGGKMGNLQLFQIVDAHGVAVTLACQPDFHEVADHVEFKRLPRNVTAGHREAEVRGRSRFAAGDVELIQNAVSNRRHRKRAQRSPHVATGVAVLQTARKNLIQCCTRHDAQLAGPGNRTRQSPIRNSNTHATLNDLR